MARFGLRIGLRIIVATATFCFLVIFVFPFLLIYRAICGRQAYHAIFGKIIAFTAHTLGSVPIKFAQIMSYRHDLLPPSFLTPLSELQDRVPSSSTRMTAKEIEAALGSTPKACFETFDTTPIGVGSVANVYKAKTYGGKNVAVKIVRPTAIQSIETDIKIVTWFTGLLGRLPIFRGVPISDTILGVTKMIEKQVDMDSEKYALSRLKNENQNMDKIFFPDVIDVIKSKNVLVMELIDDYHKLDINISDNIYQSACDKILDSIYHMIFISGFIHCDIHPGNILIKNDGKIYLIDAGMTSELNDDDKRAFRELFLALAVNDRKKFTDSIISSATRVPHDLDILSLSRDSDEILNEYSGKAAGEFLIAKFVFNLFELQRRYGLFGAPGFVNAVWALVMLEGLLREPYARLDFQKLAIPYILGESELDNQ